MPRLQPPAPERLAERTRAIFRAVESRYGAVLEPIAVTPGVSGTHCQQHVTVLTGDFFSDTPVFPAGGPVGLSFHDLLWNWLNAAGPARQVQPDGIAGPPYTPSNC